MPVSDGSGPLQEQYADYARALAMQIARPLPREVDREDLVGFALVGLAEAAASYDPSRGASFETFAYYRIRGSVFNGLGKMNWLPPRVRRMINADANADSIASGTDATVTDASVAASQFVDAVQRVGAVFLAADAAEIAEDSREGTSLPGAAMEAKETRALVQSAVRALPEESRELVHALYFEGESMTSYGERLGLNKSSISRRHRQAIGMLRDALAQACAETRESFPSE